MERISAKHGARLDDELARETETLTRATPSEARAEEWRMAEPPADGEPLADARLAGDLPGVAPGALPVDEIEARSELATALRPSAFPADAPSLRRVAHEEGAPAWVLDLLARIDQVSRFDTVGDLWRAAGGHADGGNAREPDTGVSTTPAPESASSATMSSAPRPAAASARAARAAPARPATAAAPDPAATERLGSRPGSDPDPAGDGDTGPTGGGNLLGRGIGFVVGVGNSVVREGIRTGGRVARGALRLVRR